jgi:hypothetical protein
MFLLVGEIGRLGPWKSVLVSVRLLCFRCFQHLFSVLRDRISALKRQNRAFVAMLTGALLPLRCQPKNQAETTLTRMA